MKQCNKCKKDKSYECFSKTKQSKDGLYHMCKECRNVYIKDLRLKKAGGKTITHRKFESYIGTKRGKLTCKSINTLGNNEFELVCLCACGSERTFSKPSRFLERQTCSRECGTELWRESYGCVGGHKPVPLTKLCSKCGETKDANKKNFSFTTKGAIKCLCRSCEIAYSLNRYRTNIQVRMTHNLGARIRSVIKDNRKSDNTRKLLGCSFEFFMKHMEDQFQEGMTWDNYGNPNGDQTNCWHVDHIKPCKTFDLSDPKEQHKCFHYSNLQPLWAKDNLSKGCNF